MKVMVPFDPEKILVTSSLSDTNPSAWGASTAYTKGSAVTYAHGVWVALADNTAKYPDREPEIWTYMHPATPAEWLSSKAYAAGDTVRYKRRRYTSTKDSNTGYLPDASSEWWLSAGPVNSWAAFDRAINTKTAALNEISFELDFSRCNAVAVFGLEGATLHMSLRNSTGDLVMEKIITMASFDVTSWLEYFLDPVTPREDVITTDFPVMTYSRLTITISAPGSTARVGQLSVGRCKTLGQTQFEAEAGICDYSRKTTDTFGNTYLAEGNWAKAIRLALVLSNEAYDDVFRTLARLRATPTVFIGDNTDKGFDTLTVWGFARDFRMVIKGPTHSQCSLDIQGLI